MYRITKNADGYIVEIEISKWTFFGLKKEWKPFVKSTGLDSAWNHKTFDHAMMNLLKEVENNQVEVLIKF